MQTIGSEKKGLARAWSIRLATQFWKACGVEFAKESYEHGKSLREAALEAAELRLRPILMTSFAFILGVFPLVIASGASSGARRALGTAVFGGMIAATLLAIFIVPVLFLVIERIATRSKVASTEHGGPEPEVAR